MLDPYVEIFDAHSGTCLSWILMEESLLSIVAHAYVGSSWRNLCHPRGNYLRWIQMEGSLPPY